MERFANNYRLVYIYASALEETGAAGLAAERFADLLGFDQEIPGRKPFSAGRSQNPHSRRWIGDMPPKTLEYLRLMNETRTVYQHRQLNRYGSRSGFAVTNLRLPADVEAVRLYALLHLLELRRMGLDDEEITTVDELARAHGVTNLGMLSELLPTLQSRYQVDHSLIEENPHDQDLLALWVLLTINGRHQYMDPALLKHAVDTFQESYPKLALIAGLRGSTSDESLVPPTLELLEKVDAPGAYLFQAIVQFLNNPLESESQISAKLTTQMTAWYPKVSQSPGYVGAQMYSLIIHRLAQREDPTAFLKFLDDEVARYRKGRNSVPSHTYYQSLLRSSRQQPKSFMQPLEFPPTQLAGFPPQVLGLLASASNRSSRQAFMFTQITRSGTSGRLVDLTDNVTLESLSQVKDPILRLLLANRLDKKELVEELLQSMLDAETPNINTYLLAAAHTQSQGRPLETIRILENARTLPMERATRKSVDAAIVAAALDSQNLEEKHKEIAHKAARRLSKATLQPTERQLLIPALATSRTGAGGRETRGTAGQVWKLSEWAPCLPSTG